MIQEWCYTSCPSRLNTRLYGPTPAILSDVWHVLFIWDLSICEIWDVTWLFHLEYDMIHSYAIRLDSFLLMWRDSFIPQRSGPNEPTPCGILHALKVQHLLLILHALHVGSSRMRNESLIRDIYDVTHSYRDAWVQMNPRVLNSNFNPVVVGPVDDPPRFIPERRKKMVKHHRILPAPTAMLYMKEREILQRERENKSCYMNKWHVMWYESCDMSHEIWVMWYESCDTCQYVPSNPMELAWSPHRLRWCIWKGVICNRERRRKSHTWQWEREKGSYVTMRERKSDMTYMITRISLQIVCSWWYLIVSCRTYERDISYVWRSHGSHMNESWHTYEWVMAHIWMGHGTHINDVGCAYFAQDLG